MPYLAAIALTALLAVNATLLAVMSARVPSRCNVQGFAPRFMPHQSHVMLMTALSIVALLPWRLVHRRRPQATRW
jgi:hypothetical protein